MNALAPAADAAALFGDELKESLLSAHPAIDDRGVVEFDDWPAAVPFLLELWGDGDKSMSDLNVLFDVRVKHGTCYSGTRILLWNDVGGTHSFKAVLADVGFGFDTTAAAVTEENYRTEAKATDGPIANWRVINKMEEADPERRGGARFDHLLAAMLDVRYQQPVRAPKKPAPPIAQKPRAGSSFSPISSFSDIEKRSDAELQDLFSTVQAEVRRREVAAAVAQTLQAERAEINSTRKRQADKESELDTREAKFQQHVAQFNAAMVPFPMP